MLKSCLESSKIILHPIIDFFLILIEHAIMASCDKNLTLDIEDLMKWFDHLSFSILSDILIIK